MGIGSPSGLAARLVTGLLAKGFGCNLIAAQARLAYRRRGGPPRGQERRESGTRVEEVAKTALRGPPSDRSS